MVLGLFYLRVENPEILLVSQKVAINIGNVRGFDRFDKNGL